MSLLPIKRRKSYKVVFEVLSEPTRLAKTGFLVFLPSLLLPPLLFYTPSVLIHFYGMLLSVDGKDRKSFLFNLLAYLATSGLLVARYFPNGIGWTVIILLYALFVFGLGGIFLVYVVMTTGVINKYSPDSKRFKDKSLNLIEYVISYLALFAVGSFRIYTLVGGLVVISLPIIFYCSDNSGYACYALTPFEKYMESVMSWSFISKSLIYIALFGALVNYVVYFLKRE